jgi:hypothetical protein
MSKENDLFTGIKDIISLQNMAIMSGVELGRKESEDKIKTLESVNAKLVGALREARLHLALIMQYSCEDPEEHYIIKVIDEAIKEAEGKL